MAAPVNAQISVNVAADARVLESSPTTNYGTVTRLDVDNPGQESYLRFTVSGVSGAVQNATLRFWVTNGSTNGPSLYPAGSGWTETGITWNNRPGATSGAVANLGAITASTWVEMNVTAQITGNGTFDFVLMPDSTDGVTFYSREGSSPPQLVLTISSEPVPTSTNTPIPPTATNTPTPTNTSTTGPSPTPTNTPLPPTATNTPILPSPTNTRTLTSTPTSTNTPNGGAIILIAAADARVLQTSPTTNYGSVTRLDVDNPGQESYLRFTVSGATGPVQSAILRLWVTNGSSNGPSLYQAGGGWTETGLTWNNRPGATSGAIANVGAITANTWAEFNITAQVTGNGSYDFVLMPDSTDGVTFHSREGSSKPQLVLTFSSGPAPTPTDTPTPGPSPTQTNTPTPTNTPTVTNTPSSGGIIFVGAGDIADCSRVEDERTAQLLDNIPGTVFTIGDNAYPNGAAASFSNCYEPTWGRHKSRTHPAVGDNEYSTSGASGYFNYFGAAAGDPTKGYYSYNLGSWHIITLNSNCSNVGGCGPNSPQGQWLQADLNANQSSCILAIHHEPLFSSKSGDGDLVDFWNPLYAAGADIVLSGHRHNYERFAQQTPNGVLDPGRGIRQFVVGTGGSSLSSFNSGTAANSQVRNANTYGVLKLTLHENSYDWVFIPIAGQTFTNSGSAQCVTP